VPFTERLDRAQRRVPVLGFPLAVIYKYFDDFGPYLSALITYYAFVSLFPLLLLSATVLGWILRGDPALQQQLFHSALHDFPVIGDQLGQPKRLGGGTAGLVIGIVGSLYGGLGVAQAAQYAMNTAWAVPRNSRPNPFKARGRSLLLLLTAGVAVLGTTVLATFGSGDVGSFGVGLKVVVIAGSVAINTVAYLFAFRLATARDVSLRDIWPGAVAAAVVWQLLQSFGVLYVERVVRHASETNGVFAVVLGLLAFLYVNATALVLCVEINVVRVDRLHPRSLLTPFTDDVSLTGGDRRVYTGQAKAQRSKGFETVDVEFHPERSDAD
jgi:YihY family inner membrane protein